MEFDPVKLRSMRKTKGIALKEVAAQMDMSVAQIQRIETGHRRLNVDTLIKYCDVLGVDVVELLRERPMIPIIGVLNQHSELLPLKANTKHQARAPFVVPDPHRLAAVRWETEGQFSPINGHLMLFYADITGIPELSWGHRNIIRRKDGTHRAGWLINENGKIHVDDTHGRIEYDIDVDWASPIIAVVPPFLVE